MRLHDRVVMVAFLTFIQDIEGLGRTLKGWAGYGAGPATVEPFYWDMNDGTRDFSRRWSARMGGGKMPSSNHAGLYSATLACPNAAARMHSSEASAIVPEVKREPLAN